MKLFHFYIDSDEQQSVGYYKLIFPFCKTKMGYGMFWWGLDNMGFMKTIDYLGKENAHSYFENGTNSIKNYDDGMGRWGKNKLQELNDSKYIKVVIKQIFENDDMLQAMKMWRSK